jgi:hypothetical protein
VRKTRSAPQAAIAAVALMAGAAWGQTGPRSDEILQRLQARDHEGAARLIDVHLRRYPADAVMLYNAACLHCRRGEPDLGATYLIRAVKAGFGNVSHLRRDPDLRSLREHPVYRAILAARDAADERLAQRRLEHWRRTYGSDTYRYATDETRRLIFATALDERAEGQMRRMLEEQAAHLRRTLFEAASPQPRNYVLIAVPTPQDAARMLKEPHVAGVYNHQRRELVTRDTGRSLRHEFVHVLHHSHMDELGQEHPLWIQEGLASLGEDYRLTPDGTVIYPANDRHAIAKTLARTGRLMTWPELFALSKRRLRTEAPRVYPQLRSIFRFVAETGRLQAWYRRYVERFDEDPSGVRALETVLENSTQDLEHRWRRWFDAQPVMVTRSAPLAPPPDVRSSFGDSKAAIPSRSQPE